MTGAWRRDRARIRCNRRDAQGWPRAGRRDRPPPHREAPPSAEWRRQPGAAPRRAPHAEGTVYAAAKHLHAAAQPDSLAAVARVTKDCFAPTRLFQVAEISAHVLAAGQNDEVGRGKRLARPHEADLRRGVPPQRIEVGVVADARVSRDHDPEGRGRSGGLRLGERILRLQSKAAQKRQDAVHRLVRLSFQPLDAGEEKLALAAKAVDDEAPDPRALILRQAPERADNFGEDTAAVDICDEQERALRWFGQSPVGEVV